MDILNDIYYSSSVLEVVQTFLQTYSRQVWSVFLIICLLNCFAGYHLRKLWGVLAGFVLGGTIAAGVCIHAGKTGTIVYLISLLSAFILAFLALLLYRVGLFFMSITLTALVFSRLFPTQDSRILLIWSVIGCILGVLTLVNERYIVSLITAISGGFGSSFCFFTLYYQSSSLIVIFLGVILAILGLLIQFQPWRSRTAWNSDEERRKEKYRHKRRMRKMKHHHQQQERQAARSRSEKPHSWSDPSASRTENSYNRSSSAPQRTSSEYIPYSTHPVSGRDSVRTVPTGQGQPYPPVSADRIPPSGQEQSNRTPASPDLSDVRQQISREVSDIFQERQSYMDETFNNLLAKEYKNTTEAIRNESTSFGRRISKSIGRRRMSENLNESAASDPTETKIFSSAVPDETRIFSSLKPAGAEDFSSQGSAGTEDFSSQIPNEAALSSSAVPDETQIFTSGKENDADS